MTLKKMKILAAAALCAIMCSCSADTVKEQLPDAKESTEKNTDDLYNALYIGLSSYSDKISFKGSVDFDDVKKAMDSVRRDHPEIFWVDGYTISSSKLRSEIKIDVMDGYTADELREMQGELYEAAKLIANAIPTYTTDADKISCVHDSIIYNTVYDHSVVSEDDNGLWGTAYGCLVQGNAVCQGYAEAFQYIMQMLDIPCGTVTGMMWNTDPYSQNGGTAQKISHAWNYVLVGGKYYWIDVTCDDPDNDKVAGSPLMHTYYLVDDERIFRLRELDPGQPDIPECRSMDENYYVKNGTYISEYSIEAVGRAMQTGAFFGEAEMMFADKAVYDEAMDDLFGQGNIWKMSEYADIGSSVNYTNDDTMYVLKIAFNN